jgi:hypothetical protein
MNTDAFCRDLAKIAAKQLARVKPEDRDLATMQLQEATSLFSPYTADLIEQSLRRHDRRGAA